VALLGNNSPQSTTVSWRRQVQQDGKIAQQIITLRLVYKDGKTGSMSDSTGPSLTSLQEDGPYIERANAR
jgi:hypothetical protein